MDADEHEREDEHEDATFEARVIRSFIRDGRLTSIPARERRRQVIYRYLRDQVFTEDRSYLEKEVNQRLALFHADVATIRRGMVDAGLVTRKGGDYRRGT
jgi:ArsR family transcriptional regulator, arsenate/arsenite/antimonite-responsive transcriptional repressor